MSAATDYAALQDAVATQHHRIIGPQPAGDFWGNMAQLYRMDPHRALDTNLGMIASYVRPDDVFIDVGGGAGRVCLPMTLRCREVVLVEPSPGMGAEFDAIQAEAGILNARRVHAEWMEPSEVVGDVVFAGCVTYFVRDIVPFVEKLVAAARRRVIITLWSEPPGCNAGPLFELVHGEPQAPQPGFRQLMSVLWEMNILPDLLVLPGAPWWESEKQLSREDTLERALGGSWYRPEQRERAYNLLDKNFERLFSGGPDEFRPNWRRPIREVLITWETT